MKLNQNIHFDALEERLEAFYIILELPDRVPGEIQASSLYKQIYSSEVLYGTHNKKTDMEYASVLNIVLQDFYAVQDNKKSLKTLKNQKRLETLKRHAANVLFQHEHIEPATKDNPATPIN